jgi:hypothetical protein
VNTYEDPDALRGRLRLGREEYCQRLLTSLIVGGPYPRWNSRSAPSPHGARYLQLLDDAAFGNSRRVAPIFVDELDLPSRREEEKGCAPDQAAIWPDRLWMIELKTERGSHRRGQLTSYFVLGRHHFPSTAVDLLYLTPPMEIEQPDVPDGSRFAHLNWYDVRPLIDAVWGASPDELERRIADRLMIEIDGLTVPASRWRAALGTTRAPEPAAAVEQEQPAATDPVDAALSLAREVEADRKQKAVEHRTSGVDEMLELRLKVRDALATPGSPAPHVRPWIWRWASAGQPLTAAGRETGYELRLSYYGNR